MTWSENLLDELNSENSKLVELLQVKYSDYDCIVAVEGKDDVIFYHDFLEAKIGDNFLSFICDNKDGVINLKSACDNYNWPLKPKFLYLCDKDYDYYLDKLVNGIHYTENYSIESDVTSKKFISYALRKEITPKPTSVVINSMLEKYELQVQRLSEHLKKLSCIMIEIRSRDIHPEFDKLSVMDFFIFEKKTIKERNIDYTSILSSWGLDEEKFSIIEQSSRWEKFIASNDYTKWVRGKYLLQISKKCFELILKSEYPKHHANCINYLGKDGFKVVKLALDKIDTLHTYIDEQMAA